MTPSPGFPVPLENQKMQRRGTAGTQRPEKIQRKDTQAQRKIQRTQQSAVFFLLISPPGDLQSVDEVRSSVINSLKLAMNELDFEETDAARPTRSLLVLSDDTSPG